MSELSCAIKMGLVATNKLRSSRSRNYRDGQFARTTLDRPSYHVDRERCVLHRIVRGGAIHGIAVVDVRSQYDRHASLVRMGPAREFSEFTFSVIAASFRNF